MAQQNHLRVVGSHVDVVVRRIVTGRIDPDRARVSTRLKSQFDIAALQRPGNRRQTQIGYPGSCLAAGETRRAGQDAVARPKARNDQVM